MVLIFNWLPQIIINDHKLDHWEIDVWYIFITTDPNQAILYKDDP